VSKYNEKIKSQEKRRRGGGGGGAESLRSRCFGRKYIVIVIITIIIIILKAWIWIDHYAFQNDGNLKCDSAWLLPNVM
jgi:cytoskeletal protein RodZ